MRETLSQQPDDDELVSYTVQITRRQMAWLEQMQRQRRVRSKAVIVRWAIDAYRAEIDREAALKSES